MSSSQCDNSQYDPYDLTQDYEDVHNPNHDSIDDYVPVVDPAADDSQLASLTTAEDYLDGIGPVSNKVRRIVESQFPDPEVTFVKAVPSKLSYRGNLEDEISSAHRRFESIDREVKQRSKVTRKMVPVKLLNTDTSLVSTEGSSSSTTRRSFHQARVFNDDSRSRGWCATIFDEEASTTQLDKFKSLDCDYIYIGEEICPSTGRKHGQCFLWFRNARTFKSLRRAVAPSHIEPQSVYSTTEQAIRYCEKDGKCLFERGNRPLSPEKKGKGEQLRWVRNLEAATTGNFDQMDPQSRFLHMRIAQAHHERYLASVPKDYVGEQNIWIHGPSGCGKTRYVHSHPDYSSDLYIKSGNKWWDNYLFQQFVLFDDFSKHHSVLVDHLKQWAGGYPFVAEYKGGSKVIRPKKIIITSNYHPNELWTDEAGELEPILRRFKVVLYTDMQAYLSSM